LCFSAAGSFSAAALLAGIGAASVARNEARPLRMLAAVPLLFSVQQAAEGVVWTRLDEHPPGAVARLAVFVFLAFALVVWPVWLPASLKASEEDPRRRRVLARLAWLGASFGAVAAVLLLRSRPSAHLSGHRIAYEFSAGIQGVLPLIGYVLPSVVPFFVSTTPLTRVIGVLLVGALAATFVAERNALTSVWCFFAALLSALILVIVLRARTGSRSLSP
jgi:hypothetical protein